MSEQASALPQYCPAPLHSPRRPPFAEIAMSKTVNVLFKIIVAVAINGQRPKFPPDFPAPLKSIVERCWGEDPKQRPSCAELVRRRRHTSHHSWVLAEPLPC